MISVEKEKAETIAVRHNETQSNPKTSVKYAGYAKSQTKDTPNLRRKVRQIAVDSSEILENSTAIFGIRNFDRDLRNRPKI